MFLFMILAAIILLLLVFIVTVIAVGGAIFTVVFGDVIVCIFIFGAIGYWLIKRRKK